MNASIMLQWFENQLAAILDWLLKLTDPQAFLLLLLVISPLVGKLWIFLPDQK
jgi:hypothetical protein